MTKEEAIKVFRSYAIWDLMDNFTTDELQEMINAIVSTSSLPSNLDEAAKEYMRNYIPFDQCDSRDIRCAFKAGAEWMAGQGVTKEAVIGMATEEISINVSQETLDELDLCPGDNVVVQIRKK